MIASRFLIVRRLMALPQLAALTLSFGLAFEASLCPPGMDTGMEMSMPMGAGLSTGSDRFAGQQADLHCVFSASTDQDGRTTCPFAVGGVGPCGTTMPTPGVGLAVPSPIIVSGMRLVSNPHTHTDPFTPIQLPPPRV